MKRSLLLLVSGLVLSSASSYAQSWNKIGIDAPTTNWADLPNITADRDGNIYASFSNFSGKQSVMKYSGGSWTAVGADNVTAGSVGGCGVPPSMATNATGTLYMAFPDTNAKATVLKFDGSSW